MVSFAIIEFDLGLTIATVQPDQEPQEAANDQGGVLVDPGPYATYEDAYDALIELEAEVERD